MFPRPRPQFVRAALAGRPRVVIATVAVLTVCLFLSAGWLALFSYDLTAGLPDKNALRGLGDMAQATTIYDAGDKVVFTIFKEQRIDVPLGRISPDLVKAGVSVEEPG